MGCKSSKDEPPVASPTSVSTKAYASLRNQIKELETSCAAAQEEAKEAQRAVQKAHAVNDEQQQRIEELEEQLAKPPSYPEITPRDVIAGLTMDRTPGQAREECADDEVMAQQLQRQFDSEPQPTAAAPTITSPTSRWKAAAKRATQRRGGASGQNASTQALGGLTSIVRFCSAAAGRGTASGTGSINDPTIEIQNRIVAEFPLADLLQSVGGLLREQSIQHVEGGSKQKDLKPDEINSIALVMCDCVRSVLVAPVERRQLQNCCEAKAGKDSELRTRCELFVSKSQTDMGIPDHLIASDDFATAVQAVEQFDSDTSCSLHERLRLLLAVKEEVERTYSREARARGADPTKKPIAADDFLPVFSFVVSRAEHRNINGVIQYIHQLSGGAVMGEAMYYLCMLEAAVQYLLTVDISNETQMRNMMELNTLQTMLQERGVLAQGRFAALKDGRLETRMRAKR